MGDGGGGCGRTSQAWIHEGLHTQVPWDDLRYLFGEIMYGGHITDDWDRRLCRTYLLEFVRPEMLEGEVMLAPGFHIPPNLDYKVLAGGGSKKKREVGAGVGRDTGRIWGGFPALRTWGLV